MHGTSAGEMHAFISYVREDAQPVAEIAAALEGAGIQVWLDTEDLLPGDDWAQAIRSAVSDRAMAFIAIFSDNSVAKTRTYQNEELLLAVEEMRLRQPGTPWLIPVRLSDCPLPSLDIGGGRQLSSIQRVDLFGTSRREGLRRLVAAVKRITGQPEADPAGDTILLESGVVVQRSEFDRWTERRAILPQDIVHRLQLYADHVFDSAHSIVSADQIASSIYLPLYPIADRDPVRFVEGVAASVLPVGGWAVVGGSRSIPDLLSTDRLRQVERHAAHLALLDGAVAFIFSQGYSAGHLTGYEHKRWWETRR
jgi:hypothetical protein